MPTSPRTPHSLARTGDHMGSPLQVLPRLTHNGQPSTVNIFPPAARVNSTAPSPKTCAPISPRPPSGRGIFSPSTPSKPSGGVIPSGNSIPSGGWGRSPSTGGSPISIPSGGTKSSGIAPSGRIMPPKPPMPPLCITESCSSPRHREYVPSVIAGVLKMRME